MTIETTVNDLVASVDALKASVANKRAILDTAAANADVNGSAVVASANAAQASAAAAAASATVAANTAAEVTAFKTAATALNTSTTATQAVTNLLPDMLAKKDPARHPFRNKLPSLVLDFERQKAHRYSDSTGFAETPLSSLMTFVRNSTATYTGPDGVLRTAAANTPRYDYDPVTGECKGILIEEQRTNLKTNSDLWPTNVVTQYATAYPTDIVSIQGLTNLGGGIKLVESVSTGTWHNAYFTCNTIIGGTYTYSTYAKSGTRSKIGLYVNSRVQTTVIFDLVTLTATSIATDPIVGFGCQAAGNGWVRCWITFEATKESQSLGISLHSGTTSAAYNGDGASYAYFACPQLEAGAFPTSYIPTPATFTRRTTTATYLDVNGVVQTAGVGVARSAAYVYDADGVLRPIGLLLEPAATNLLLHSSNYSLSPWFRDVYGAAGTPTITPAYSTAPDGTLTANRVQMALNGSSTLGDWCTISQQVTTVAGSTYTASVWLKTADASTKVVRLSFNGENPQLLTVTGTWKRYSITGVASDTIRGFRLALHGTTGTSDSADLLVWGAQHELGYYPTSYIPTTTVQVTRAADTSTSAQATRAADDATLTGTNFSSWYNQEQGTLAGSVRLGSYIGNADSAGVRPGIAAVDDGTSNNAASLGTTKSSAIRTNNTSVLDYQIDAVSANTLVRDALRLQKANFIHAGDGALGASVNNGQVPRVNILRIGKSAFASGYANAAVRRVVYYPTAFTNEELQVLTSA